MRCHENDSVSTTQAFQVMFEAVMNNEFRDIAFIELRKMSELDEQSREILESASKNALPLHVRQIRKRHLNIAQASPTLPPREVKAEPRQASSYVVRHVARHCAENAND
jgi:hypothetical protein